MIMKIYFSASRYYHEKFQQNCDLILKTLKDGGFQVLDNTHIKTTTGNFGVKDASEKTEIYKNMVKLMDKADISVFEASYPSTIHIGHEITLAIEKGKPVVVLYTSGNEPILFRGIQNEKVIWVEYDQKDLVEKLKRAVDEAGKNFDVRFNFFVSPKILSYLDWVAQKRMLPRSVFLRNLIEREMKKDKTFKG